MEIMIWEIVRDIMSCLKIRQAFGLKIKPAFGARALLIAGLAAGFAAPKQAQAYHNLCFSPFELAALLSQSGSSSGGKSGLRKIKKKLEGLETSREKYEEKLDDLEADLRNSLDSAKTGGSAKAAAKDIRNYIEQRKNEFKECEEISAQLMLPEKPLPAARSFVFKSSLWLKAFGRALLPEASWPAALARLLPAAPARGPNAQKTAAAEPSAARSFLFDGSLWLKTFGRALLPEAEANTDGDATDGTGVDSPPNNTKCNNENCLQYEQAGLVLKKSSNQVMCNDTGYCLCKKGNGQQQCARLKKHCESKMIINKTCVKKQDIAGCNTFFQKEKTPSCQTYCRRFIGWKGHQPTDGVQCKREQFPPECSNYLSDWQKELKTCKELKEAEKAKSEKTQKERDKARLEGKCKRIIQKAGNQEKCLKNSNREENLIAADCRKVSSLPLCSEYCSKQIIKEQDCFSHNFAEEEDFCKNYQPGKMNKCATKKELCNQKLTTIDGNHKCYESNQVGACKTLFASQNISLCDDYCKKFLVSDSSPANCIDLQKAPSFCSNVSDRPSCVAAEVTPVSASAPVPVAPAQPAAPAQANGTTIGASTVECGGANPQVTADRQKFSMTTTVNCTGPVHDESYRNKTVTTTVGRDMIDNSVRNNIRVIIGGSGGDGHSANVAGDMMGDIIQGSNFETIKEEINKRSDIPEEAKKEILKALKQAENSPAARCLVNHGGTISGGKCCANRPWREGDYAGGRGRINAKEFCGRYAKDESSCKKALKRMRRVSKSLRETEKAEDRLDEEKFRLETAQWDDESETEAEADCEYCDRIKAIKQLYEPSMSQKIGSFAAILGGGALSYFGMREARRASASANDLRAWQGLPAENNFAYNLAGLQAGFPFIGQGIYGLTNGYQRQGSFGCSQTAHHYPRGPGPVMHQTPYW